MVQTRLKEYRRKRDFRRTREPSGEPTVAASGQLYVMHKHAARQDHFDLRLEQDGVLRSWALPKGPPLESGEKRLAVEVEDHPLDYGGFEGTIPQGEYGAGTVMLWDQGQWQPNGRNDADQLDFVLNGEKLKGTWTLVRTRSKVRTKQSQWLLIKRSDRSRLRLEPDDRSVISGRSMAQIARAGSGSPPRAGMLSGARPAPLPERIAPQLATLSEQAPRGAGWLHEIKFDGYRILARIDQGEVRLLTRNGQDWTARFPAQARQLQQLPIEQAFLDGEMVAVTAEGVSDFRGLQEALSRKQTAQLRYQLFDLPHLDGHDLSAVPLEDRKHVLAELLASTADSTPLLQYSDHVTGQGEAFFEQACQLGLEGIVTKRADAPYRSGRGTLWRKLKCTRHDEFVVGGYSPPTGSRSGFGALLLGAWRDAGDDRLVYMGRVGTGFSQDMLDELYVQLQRLVTDESPFVPGPALAQVPRGTRWVTPRLVAEVEYTERTGDGLLRHSRFRGLREDRRPEEIRLDEEPLVTSPTVRRDDRTRVAGITLTHPERSLYPDLGVTKLELARYYAAIADWILPWLANRPLALLRCPEGQDQDCFYQKHLDKSQAKSVGRVAIAGKKRPRDYVYVRSVSDIIALVQHGVLEFHPWGCQVADIEHPDLLVFDLDPAPEVAWEPVLDTARALRDRLEGLGFTAYPRVTGGKGLHVVVPLEPRADWATAKAFARALSEQQVRDAPDILTVQMAKTKRRGRIFIDWLRNSRGATAIANYSTRARPGAPVAVPLRWDELSPALRADRYTLNNLRRRLGALRHDPWEDFYEAAVPLDADRLRAVGLES